MKHIHSWSVFEDLSTIPGEGTLAQRLSSMGMDGLELFTLTDPVPECYLVPECVSVHLPYAIDWRSAWEGREYEGEPDDRTYFSFGRGPDEMVATIGKMIRSAEAVRPAYGVLHAGNTDLRQVLNRKHMSDDLSVIRQFCEMVNRAVAGLPGGEPPFRLAFENLWWEGLRLRDPQEWRVMEKELEFDNWGFVLDTGHLMNTLDDAFDEPSAIEGLRRVTDSYPQDMKDRICTMHLQLSTTAEFRMGIRDDSRHDGETWDEFQLRAYRRASDIDQHRPFTSPAIKEVVEDIAPEFLVHELMGSLSGDRWGDLKCQRALFRPPACVPGRVPHWRK